MIVLSSNIILGLVSGIIYLLQIRIIVDLIISVGNIRIQNSHPVMIFLMTLTEPFCKPFKRILPLNNNGMEIIFAIATLSTFKNALLYYFANYIAISTSLIS